MIVILTLPAVGAGAGDGKPLTSFLRTTDDDGLLRLLVHEPLSEVSDPILDRSDWADALDETEAWLASSLSGKT